MTDMIVYNFNEYILILQIFIILSLIIHLCHLAIPPWCVTHHSLAPSTVPIDVLSQRRLSEVVAVVVQRVVSQTTDLLSLPISRSISF